MHGSFDQILERFELYLNAKAGTERVQRGLGYNNLLFMALRRSTLSVVGRPRTS